MTGGADGYELEIRVLGPLVVLRRGAEVALGGRLQRLVLSVLVVDAGNVVPNGRLLEDVWGAAAPRTGTGALRTYVWALRRVLGPEVLPSRGGGYLVDIDAERLDSVRFELQFAQAREAAISGHPAESLARLDAAVGLWRGPAFGDLATEPAIHQEADRLDQLFLDAQELRGELMLGIGHPARAATELGVLARRNPHRERLWVLLMTALYRSGRQGEALRGYQEARQGLVETMGVEPGPELRELEQAILRHDPALHDGHGLAAGTETSLGAVAETGDGRDPARAGGSAATRSNRQHPVPGDGRFNLPSQLTSFVGREAERAAVAELLERARLVTLSGSGGCGKTRLALAVADDTVRRFAGGVWFVDLSSVSDPALVPRAVAGTFGVELGRGDRLGPLCRYLADEVVLLVLDNCEHLADPVTDVADELLTGCPALRVLATSRHELGFPGESVWRVPGLRLPTEDGRSSGRARMLQSDAVQLFIERGRPALPGFAPEGRALDAVVMICRRLDGMPLALELAAALVGSLPVTEIAERLDDRFRLLVGDGGHRIPRHRTLQATLDWSFDLLDEPAQTLFAQLSVFVGEFTLPAAEAVAGIEPDPLAVARGLGHLVRTSMVSCVASSDGAQRYRMLESVRQYAHDRLEACDHLDETHRRHAAFFADFAAEAERHVHRPAASEWLARVVSELPNLRAAVAWAVTHDEIDTGLRAAGSLRWFFARMARLDEVAGWLDIGLARQAELPTDLQLMTLTAASTVAFVRGDYRETLRIGEEAIALARELDDAHQLAVALIARGAATVYEEGMSRAESCFEEAQALCARLGDQWGTAWLLTFWATGSRRAGQHEYARQQLQEALDTFRDLGDVHGQIIPLVNLAFSALEDGLTADALELADEALRIAVSIDDRSLQHVSLTVLGRVELLLGHHPRARDMLLRSIRDFPGSHTWLMLTIALEGLAELAMIADQPDHAIELLGFTLQARERWQISPSTSRARQIDDWLEQARKVTSPDQFNLALHRGRTMDLNEALALAEAATKTFATDPSS